MGTTRACAFASSAYIWLSIDVLALSSELQCDGGSVRKFDLPERLNYKFFQCNADDKSRAESDSMHKIVEDYSQRQLTFSTDMLPALSGIATRFASILQDTYCAGLWRNDLQRSLVWSADSFDLKARPSKYRAPSWSWASVDTKVYWFPRDTKIDSDVTRPTRIVDCETQPLYATARFGEVRSGVLELRGRVRDLDWNGADWIATTAEPRLGIVVVPDARKETLERGDSNEVPDLVDFYMGKSQEAFNKITRSVSCIPITDEFSSLLERRRDGKYVRLGLVSFFLAGFELDEEWYSTESIQDFYKDTRERTILVE